jgi:hypothetical protein
VVFVFFFSSHASLRPHVEMETLADTSWDVIIAGTGLAESLVAL